MSSSWDDFEESTKEKKLRDRSACNNKERDTKEDDGTGCDWGFDGNQETRDDNGELAVENSNLSKFIELYECYLEDKHSINSNTKNFSTYGNNPQKALQEWFDNEGHEFQIKIKQPKANQYVGCLDLPIEDQDFSINSECHSKRQDATDEVCLLACRMLDECQLLYSWQSSAASFQDHSDRKRRADDANKEDDIELDQTCTKRHCDLQKSVSSKLASKVNTYESLMVRWNELNFSIVKLKAELVKLDLSVAKQTNKRKKSATTHGSQGIEADIDGNQKTNSDTTNSGETEEEDDEIDPLDEYMSSLETKTKLTMDEKIHKSRIKTQIAAYEREQAEVSRFIELAKPKFDLNKACPPTTTAKTTSSDTPKKDQ